MFIMITMSLFDSFKYRSMVEHLINTIQDLAYWDDQQTYYESMGDGLQSQVKMACESNIQILEKTSGFIE